MNLVTTIVFILSQKTFAIYLSIDNTNSQIIDYIYLITTLFVLKEIIKYSDIQLIKNYIYIILYYRHQDLKQQNNYIVCINLTFQLNLFLLKMK